MEELIVAATCTRTKDRRWFYYRDDIQGAAVAMRVASWSATMRRAVRERRFVMMMVVKYKRAYVCVKKWAVKKITVGESKAVKMCSQW